MSNPPPPPSSDEPTGSGQPTPPNPYGALQQPAYGGAQPPYGQPPYGQPPAGGGYAPNPYGEAPKTDGVSITAFVLSLTFCLSVIGVILGFVGLSRTKDGKRKGRWAAITAIAVGLLFTVIAGILVAVIGIFAASQVSIDEAKAGVCVDIDEDDDLIAMTEKECSEPHDAQIIYTGDAGDDAEAVQSGELNCATRAEAPIQELIASGDYLSSGLVEDPDDVSADDKLVCYLERADGKKLSEKLG